MKHRSVLNFGQQYNSFKNGYAVGIENFAFMREEVTPGTFNPPRIGTQGCSTSGATPSTDLSLAGDGTIVMSVDGGAPVTVSLTVAGLTSGALIAAAIETQGNLALGAAGQDGRIWVEYTGSVYKIYAQKTNTAGVVVSGGTLADELKLGLANAGTETTGTDSPDWFWTTKMGIKHSQDFEMSKHKSGRQPSNIIKKKKMLEGDVELYVNMAGGSTVDIDDSVALLLQCVFGQKTVGANSISFDQKQPPSTYFSILQGNNTFNRVANGCYVKNFTITLPGDGEASMKFTMKGRESKECSIGKVNGPVTASTSVILENGEAGNFEPDCRVMIIDADGRTVLAGVDGGLKVNAVDLTTHTLTLSSSITCLDGSFVAPWLPHVFGFGGIDNPVTGLQGSVSFDGGATTIEEIRSVEISVDPKTEDLDNYYGTDTNRGYVVGDRSEISVKVEMNLSASQFKKIQQSRRFESFSMKVVLGPANGRRLEIECPKVMYKIPGVEIPDTGTVPVTFEGFALQQVLGSLDAVLLSFK
jgi:hypothetical protein